LQVIDVSNPANPQRVGGYSAAVAGSVFVSGNHAFVAGGSLFILNLYTPVSLAAVPGPQPGAFGVSIHGLAGVQVEIERSLDLIHWQQWTNGVLGSTPLTFRDNDANPRQFYRALTR
jgi:hypothetical protein